MIRVRGFRTAAAKRACQYFKENAQNFCLIPFQDLIERIVPVTSIGRFIIVLTPHIQERAYKSGSSLFLGIRQVMEGGSSSR